MTWPIGASVRRTRARAARRLWKRREVEKSKSRTFPPRLEIPQKALDSHFPPATAADTGYISNVSTALLRVTFSNGLMRLDRACVELEIQIGFRVEINS